MLFTNDCFSNSGLWHGSKSKGTLGDFQGRFTDVFYFTSSLEYAICYSMRKAGCDAGSIKKVSFRKEVNLFSGECKKDMNLVRQYIAHKKFAFSNDFELSRLASEDFLEVFRDKNLQNYETGNAVYKKIKFLNILKECGFDGFKNYEGCERYSISPVLLKQESFGIFDDNLIIVEDYLSDSEILESEQFLELKRKEKEYFRSHYPKRQLGQSSEDFLKGLRNNPCREGYLSVLLTDEEICECFN